ncbi:unnamed protein product [Peniophora sp. CBMAI 1063]|nr:unnamed protein product [Peniophora sp. CBMAI 1063]
MSYHDMWERYHEVRKPMLYLDERFRYPSSPSVPTLHFGLGYTIKGILHCAQKRNLMPPPPPVQPLTKKQESHRLMNAVFNVFEYLEEKLETPLFMCASASPNYVGVISLYSNHTRDSFYQPEREREMLNFIRRELNDRKQQAAWYWDSNRHGPDYVCEYTEYNL